MAPSPPAWPIVSGAPPLEIREIGTCHRNFRGLDLEDVRFPEDDHIVIDRYPQALARLLSFYGNRADIGSQRIAAVLEYEQKWRGPNQKVGVLSKEDIREMAGEEGLQAFMKLVGNDARASPGK
jgi:hypothetical protein